MKNGNTKRENNKFFRKGRANEQDAIVFINHEKKRFTVFNKNTKKFISGWVMTPDQYTEYINNNNII